MSTAIKMLISAMIFMIFAFPGLHKTTDTLTELKNNPSIENIQSEIDKTGIDVNLQQYVDEYHESMNEINDVVNNLN